MYKTILVAYDGSPGAVLALQRAEELAGGGAEIMLLAVGRIPEYAETVSEVEEAREQASRHYSKSVENAAEALRAKGITAVAHVDFGKPADSIIRHAEELGADLIVLGTNPHSVFTRRVLGATVDKVVDHAHCSVLIVRVASPEP